MHLSTFPQFLVSRCNCYIRSPSCYSWGIFNSCNLFFNIRFALRRRDCCFLGLFQDCLVVGLLLGFGNKCQCGLEECFEGLNWGFLAVCHKSKSCINIHAKYMAMLACIIWHQGSHFRPLRLAWNYWVSGNTQYVGKAIMAKTRLLRQCNRA